MPIQINDLEDVPNAVEVRVSGKLSAEDYKNQLPILEKKFNDKGKLRLLAVMDDFHGLGFKAIWEEIKFDLHHYDDFERIAIVGDRAWESWMAVVCEPFTPAPLKYFDASNYDKARDWLFADDVSNPRADAAAMTTPL